jgi:hypothetical protein
MSLKTKGKNMSQTSNYPVRAAIFDTPEEALGLIRQFQQHGFSWEHVSVICSDEATEKLFPEKLRREHTGANHSQVLNVTATGVIGIGGATAVVEILTSAGIAVMALGAFAGVAAVTTFTALMVARGFASEATDFYEQAVQEGKILVAVEVDDSEPNATEKRHLAEQLITDSGHRAIPLAH